jgi:inhibitor of cysteine peptidase
MMNRRTCKSVVLGFAPLTAVLAGCYEPDTGLTLTAEDHGRAVAVAVAETFLLKLESNATTGYAWQLVDMDSVILQNTSHEYVEDFAPPGKSGVGGTETWEFVARIVGETRLRLEYRRPWEPIEFNPAETFEVDVTVVAAE